MADANMLESTQTILSFSKRSDAPPSTAISVSTGFTYTGKDGIVECQSCKIKVNLEGKDIISLADAHGNYCRIKSNLKDESEIPAQNIASNVEERTDNKNNNVSASTLNDNANIDRQTTAEQTVQERSGHYCVETTPVDTTSIAQSFMIPQPTNVELEPEVPQSIVQRNERICSDLSIYSNYQSIKSAPCCYCPCRLCRYNNTLPIFCSRNKTCMYGFPKMNVRTLMLSLRERVSNGPLHPEFSTLESRKRNLNGNIDSYSCVAEAGFFADSSCGKERICCFYCDGNLRNHLLTYNPWREHTRWFPVCPFIVQQKGEDYIHTVLEDTKMLKMNLEDKNRTSHLDTLAVVDAKKVYPHFAVDKINKGYFEENEKICHFIDLLFTLILSMP
ncbi:uncharacterized protein LOC143047595 isoform X2 [Mytilus galloprovincialis]|uniref:uncharacterized protein LOC143047595 isoform X2 n=1 Tax=Mytilus galloprovincialis TaxID=29158 RepID=UPI003F7BB866